jgi:glycine cleavage system H lipoate-binding protein
MKHGWTEDGQGRYVEIESLRVTEVIDPVDGAVFVANPKVATAEEIAYLARRLTSWFCDPFDEVEAIDTHVHAVLDELES